MRCNHSVGIDLDRRALFARPYSLTRATRFARSPGNDINNQYTVDQLLLSPVNGNVSTTNPLTPSITTPDGVVFGYVTLEEMLIVPSYGKASVVADNLGNAYQLIDRDAAPFLYEQYETGMRSSPKERRRTRCPRRRRRRPCWPRRLVVSFLFSSCSSNIYLTARLLPRRRCPAFP